MTLKHFSFMLVWTIEVTTIDKKPGIQIQAPISLLESFNFYANS